MSDVTFRTAKTRRPPIGLLVLAIVANERMTSVDDRICAHCVSGLGDPAEPRPGLVHLVGSESPYMAVSPPQPDLFDHLPSL